MVEKVAYSKGLDGIYAAESKISRVDGIAGELIYRGYDIADLAINSNSEEVAYLLLNGKLPTALELEHFTDKLLKYRRLHNRVAKIIKDLSMETPPMKVIQTAIAALGGIWDNKDGQSAYETFLAYISQVPLIVSLYWRYLNNLPVIEPDINLSLAGNCLYMILGYMPPKRHIEIFDKILLLHMDHDLNASTFTARVVASTLAPVSAVLSAAVGALSGPLHGGANERVLEMIQEIGSIENVEPYLDRLVANKGKVMGMGHRIYRTKDPRAHILQKMLRETVKDDESLKKVAMLEKIEECFTAKMEAEGKKIYPNVDFYSGVLLSNLGIHPTLFPPVFAIARVVGWSAQVNEQWQDNKLFRPLALYVGEVNQRYVTIEERK
jgi:citrate synthase